MGPAEMARHQVAQVPPTTRTGERPTRMGVLAAASLIFCLTSGCGPDEPRPNLLIVLMDTLRPDHLGCYGYHRNTSPNIDRIAAQGVRFDNYYCSDAPCLPSRTALMSGRFGIHTGVVGHGGTAGEQTPHQYSASPLSLAKLVLQQIAILFVIA